MERNEKSKIRVGDQVVFHGLENEELNGSIGRVLQRCANEHNTFICYIESGRHEKRELRFKLNNLAPIQDKDKYFPQSEDVEEDRNDSDEEKADNDEDGPAIQWNGAIKVIVTIRGLTHKDLFQFNERKARLLETKGDHTNAQVTASIFHDRLNTGDSVRVRTLEQPGIKGHEVL